MKMYFLSKPENVKSTSQPTYVQVLTGGTLLTELSSLVYCHENTDFREIRENGSPCASRHGWEQ